MRSSKQFASTKADITDQVIIALIAILQFLFSIYMLLVVPFILAYGGANERPFVFLLYVLFGVCGLATASHLSYRRLPGRVSALLWHALLISYLLWLSPKRPGVANPESSSSPASAPDSDTALWALYAVSLIYIGVTAIVQFRRRNTTQVLE